MMVNLGIDTDAIIERHPEIETSAASQVYVAEGDAVLGVILYKDPARPESPFVINSLHEMKITPYMLSGDVQSVATAIAAELGIAPQNVYAEAFPERKVEVVKEFKDAGKTIAFVGDGINDSAALAHASVSVSFAGATDMARETADIVLMDDDLSSLILAIQVAKQAMSVVRQNTGIVVGPNLTAMVWAALIGLNPIAAVRHQQRLGHRRGDERLPPAARSARSTTKVGGAGGQCHFVGCRISRTVVRIYRRTGSRADQWRHAR